MFRYLAKHQDIFTLSVIQILIILFFSFLGSSSYASNELQTGSELDQILLNETQPYKNAMMTRNYNFSQGSIEFSTKIDAGGGGPSTSSDLRLESNEGNDMFVFAIFSADSEYAPNNYLLQEKSREDKLNNFIQKPLNSTVDFGKWYHIILDFDPGIVSLLIDGNRIANLNRTYAANYDRISLSSEGSMVSFNELTVSNGTSVSNLLDIDPKQWITPSGTTINRNMNNGDVILTLERPNWIPASPWITFFTRGHF